MKRIFVSWFALTKFRFDIGISFIILVNFALLVIAVSDKVQKIYDISTLQLCFIMLPLAIFGTWLFGFFLDKVLKYQSAYYKIAHSRIPQINEILSILKDIQIRMDKEGKK